jgi:hypothetical protein
MTKRTNTTHTTIYRRHAGKCPIKSQPLNTANCECPLWIHGRVRGKLVRQSLDTRTLSTAEMRQRDIENGRDDDPTPGGPKLVVATEKGNETIEYAASEFLKTSTGLSSSTQKLYRTAVEHFATWAANQELFMLRSIESAHIRQYFDANKNWKRNTAQTRLTHLRVWFNWCHGTKRWLQYAPTADRTLNQNGKKKGGSSSKRQPFTPPSRSRSYSLLSSRCPCPAARPCPRTGVLAAVQRNANLRRDFRGTRVPDRRQH